MNIIRHDMGPRFSEMVTVDLGAARLLYLSGQVAENPSLDITGQMREILRHIDRLLATQGATKQDLVSVTIYLRTVGDCLVLQAEGLRVAPNQSATKLRHLLDLHDADRERDLCFGTVDTWIAWHLTEGRVHVTPSFSSARR